MSGSDIIIADYYNNVIRKVSSGNITTIVGYYPGYAGSTGDGGVVTSAKLYGPNYITRDGSGNLYFSDLGNQSIREVSATCPANGGPNRLNQQDCFSYWPGVVIGTPSVPNMTYAWTPNTNLNSTTIAQPTSTWQTTTSNKVYTVTVSNANCTSSASTVTVTAKTYTGSPCRGENPALLTSTTQSFPISFSVYPNPSNDNVTIGIYDNAEYVRVIDMQGRIVFETKNTNAGEFKLDISKYTKGIYIITAKIRDTIEKQKLVVK